MPEDDGLVAPREAEAEPAEERVEVSIPAVGEETTADAYQQRARLAEDRLTEVLTAYREFRRETEAYRDRLTRQLQRRFEQRHEALMVKFIDILDNFDRALEAAQTAGDSLVEGLILVRTQLLQMLQDEGLERIPVIGMPFDPHLSEAVDTVPVEEPDQHHVVMQELLRGYRLNGRIARVSRVVIGEYAGSERTAAREDVPAQPEPRVARPAAAIEPDEPTPAAEEGVRAAELTLDEIIARVEAIDAENEPERSDPVPAIVYDDLSEIDDGVSARPDDPDAEEEPD